MDLPQLPGVQHERQLIAFEDVSDDEDDFGTGAFLKVGPARTKALAEIQRKKDAAAAERAEADRLAAAEADRLRPDVDASDDSDGEAGSRAKRSRGTPSPEKAGGASASLGTVELDASDVELLEKARHQQARMAEMQAEMEQADMQLDDEDEDDVPGVTSGSSGAGSSSDTARWSTDSPKIWLKVRAENGDEGTKPFAFA